MTTDTCLRPRQKFMLAALAADPGGSFAPVQVQKLFFLLDENLPDETDGKRFNFRPYDFGPFDKEVYGELEAMEKQGLIEIVADASKAHRRLYVLTAKGMRCGRRHLGEYGDATTSYMTRLSDWVRSVSFADLVGTIYREFPHMKERSVFSSS